MPYVRAKQYFRCIEPLMAQETLTGITVSSFPQMKKDKARKIEKQLKKSMTSHIREEAPQNTEDLYHHLIRTLGNG